MAQIFSLQLVLEGEELRGACLAQLFQQQDNVWLPSALTSHSYTGAAELQITC